MGNRTKAKVVKNKMAPPFKQAEFDILYGQGISREGGLLDLGVDHGVIRKSGAWYTYGSDQLGQGKENARTFLKDNPELADEIENKILAALGVGEPARRAEEAAAAAEQDDDKSAKTKAKDASAKDAAAKGAVRTAKKRTKKNDAELDIDSAFGEDAGGF